MNLHHPLATSDGEHGAFGTVFKDDIFYDPWVQPSSPAFTALVDRLHADIENRLHDPTKRKSSGQAVENRRKALAAVIANLMRLHEVSSLGAVIVVPLGRPKKDRYSQEHFPAYLVTRMIDDLAALGLLVRSDYEFRKVCTTIRPTPAFAKLAEALGQGPHVGRYAGAETILLKKPSGKRRYQMDRAPKEVSDLADYRDSDTTRRMREEMAAINAALANADIRFMGKAVGGSFMVRQFTMPKSATAESFDWNREGRLYRGFWQNIRRDMRRFIELDGEPVCDLDFKAMHVALAYRTAGAALEGDPYCGIVGPNGEALERGDAKVIVSNLLYRSNRMASFPKDSELVERLRAQGWGRGGDLQPAVEKRHPAIAHMFGHGEGLGLMWAESEILIAVLLELAERGISALPMHDGLMTTLSHKAQTLDIMREASGRVLERLGLGAEPLDVAEKEIIGAGT